MGERKQVSMGVVSEVSAEGSMVADRGSLGREKSA